MTENLQISNEQDFLSFIKEQAMSNGNLSIRGVAKCCGVDDMSIIRNAEYANKRLNETLTERGFQSAELALNGFPPIAVWLTIEYFAYESKAKAVMAKQLARTFGAYGIKTLLGKLNEEEEIAPPKTYLEALKALVAVEEEKERLKAEKLLVEKENLLLEKENHQLSENLDELFDYSSIIRVAKFNNCSEKLFKWRRLKVVSQELGEEIKKVPCSRYGTKNLYSHNAWRIAYPEVNLPETTTLTFNHN